MRFWDRVIQCDVWELPTCFSFWASILLNTRCQNPLVSNIDMWWQKLQLRTQKAPAVWADCTSFWPLHQTGQIGLNLLGLSVHEGLKEGMICKMAPTQLKCSVHFTEHLESYKTFIERNKKTTIKDTKVITENAFCLKANIACRGQNSPFWTLYSFVDWSKENWHCTPA